jgi:hypothetical protein
MIPSVLEKISYGVAVVALFTQRRMSAPTFCSVSSIWFSPLGL